MSTNNPPLDPILVPGDPALPRKEKFTLAEAFDYFHIPGGDFPEESSLNDERCVRAVAFLLHYCSDHGNEPITAMAAEGLAHILEFAGKNVAHTASRRNKAREQTR